MSAIARRRPLIPAVLALAAVVGPVVLAAPPGGKDQAAGVGPPAPWTIDDLIKLDTVSDWAIARDGSLAAWVQSSVVTIDGEEKRVSNLWMNRLSVAGGESIQLTQGTDSISSPAFSPDGKRIAFLSSRKPPAGEKKAKGDEDDSKPQVWVIAVDGGEATPATRLDRGIRSFGWTSNDALVLAAPESPTLWERERKEGKDTAVAIEDAQREPPVRLFTVSLDDGDAKRLTRNSDWIDSLDVSPDGKWAAVTAQQSLSFGFDETLRPRLYLVNLSTGEMTSLIDPAVNLISNAIDWSPDSSGFYLTNSYSRDPKYHSASVQQLQRVDVATRAISRIDIGWERGLSSGPIATNDGFIALLADGARNRPARYRLVNGTYQRSDLSGEHARNIDSLIASPDGSRIVYVSSSETRLPQGFAAKLDGSAIAQPQPLTKFNSSAAKKPTGRVEVIQWKGARDEVVEGLLGYPLNFEQGNKYPLILVPHGGPAGTSTDSWASSWAEPLILLRQKGAFTLEPNYHGSAGYGLDWVESIAGHYYELEIPDLQKGVDSLIAQGLVDADKLGMAGWSNGGILTADMITKDHRFKAASVGAADIEWLSDWANVDFGAGFDNYYFTGPPWEKVQHYVAKSPFFRLTEVTTPTLVHTGTEDRNVPPHQSWSLFRALQQIGKVPVRLITYPGEPHGLRKIAHQRRKVEEDMLWWDKYLFNAQPETIEGVKEGTLLASLLEREKAATVDGRYGVAAADGTLTPEFVSFVGMTVSRFEITRGQFAAFDPTVARGDGTGGGGRRPMLGVTFEQAKNYAAWLAQKLGQPVRLPTEDEMKTLTGIAGNGGNTLDHWAGYAPNADDAARLRQQISLLPDASILILPVGSGGGAKDPTSKQFVFDLDGNAAEWAIRSDGTGVALGPCADCPAEPRDDAFQPGEMCRGIRVVIGPVAPSTAPSSQPR